MSQSILRFLLPLAGAASVSLFAAMPAQASEGDAYYRCHVVGETRACDGLSAPSMGEVSVTKQVPGAYGQYLVHVGESPEKAIADARARGEQPKTVVVEQVTPRQYSAAEAYENYLRGSAS